MRSDWKRRGVGYLLLTRLIGAARAAGIGELYGEVLHENKPMLDMCHARDFAISSDPNDATLTTVRKRLAEVKVY